MQVESISCIKIIKDDGSAEYQISGSKGMDLFKGIQILAEALAVTSREGANDK